jgi:biopolymer transport protein TolQ
MTPFASPPPLIAASGLHADPLRLIADSGPVAQLVLLILLGFSVLSWAVIFERYRALKRSESESDRLLRDIGGDRRLSQLHEVAARYPASPLAAILQAGFREIIAAVNDGLGAQRSGNVTVDQARDRVLMRVRRRAEEAASVQADALDRNLGILATTGTVTPFIGLFGTVWGIMDAFQGIGVAGSASLASVAPGISEALVATAAGLAAAIPAVIGYNLLLARARRIGARIDRFVPQFMTLAETQIESGRPATAPLEAGNRRS